jgi:hypothetical protein
MTLENLLQGFPVRYLLEDFEHTADFFSNTLSTFYRTV